MISSARVKYNDLSQWETWRCLQMLIVLISPDFTNTISSRSSKKRIQSKIHGFVKTLSVPSGGGRFFGNSLDFFAFHINNLSTP